MAKRQATRRAITLGQTALSMLPSDEREPVAIGRGFRATVNGLVVTGRPTLAQAGAVGNRLRVLERGAQFVLGDLFNYCEQRFGDDMWQVFDAAEGWSLKTIQVYSWLAARVAPAVRRMDRLTIRHHLAVATLAPVLQQKWLAKAAADDEEQPWTVKRLVDAMREGEDLPATAWWALVLCQDAADQTVFLASMEAAGRSCKAVVRRARGEAARKGAGP